MLSFERTTGVRSFAGHSVRASSNSLSVSIAPPATSLRVRLLQMHTPKRRGDYSWRAQQAAGGLREARDAMQQALDHLRDAGVEPDTETYSLAGSLGIATASVQE